MFLEINDFLKAEEGAAADLATGPFVDGRPHNQAKKNLQANETDPLGESARIVAELYPIRPFRDFAFPPHVARPSWPATRWA
jgi:hypothetical protein